MGTSYGPARLHNTSVCESKLSSHLVIACVFPNWNQLTSFIFDKFVYDYCYGAIDLDRFRFLNYFTIASNGLCAKHMRHEKNMKKKN